MDKGDIKLVSIVYPDMNTAEDVLSALEKMQKRFLIDIADAAIVTKNDKGKLKVHQVGHDVAVGATGGAMWGLLLGALFLVPMFGLLLGAGTGALAGKMSEYGIDKDFMKKLDNQLKPGNSALFILVRSVTADKVIPEISQYGGYVMETNLSKSAEDALQKELKKRDMENMAPKMST